MDDPRLARYPDDVKRQIIRQFGEPEEGPGRDDRVETCAITTRVAPSFTRIGHIDLFGRRRGQRALGRRRWTSCARWCDTRFSASFLRFCESSRGRRGRRRRGRDARARRPPSLAVVGPRDRRRGDAGGSGLVSARVTSTRTTALVGGRTMDYGPFGWMDAYDPLFAKWTGSGEHFAFMNQPGAGLANFAVLAGGRARRC